MNKLIFAALVSAATAIHKADLPYNADMVEKVDPLSRYVNDDDIVQIKDSVKLAQLNKADLPYHAELVEKLDPLSRYVNDDDI